MSEGMPMPQPTAEHESLKKLVGTWNVECKYFMSPDGNPIEVQATDTAAMMGPFWIQSRFECEMFGSPFQGVATLGYDSASKEWVSTWIDSMNPFLFHFRGNYDESGKVLTMSGKGPMPATGDLTDYRTVETVVSDDERTFEMFIATPGGEMPLFHYTYRRA